MTTNRLLTLTNGQQRLVTVPLAFNYEGPIEPETPTIGQTWRERSAGNLIIGEWEWSGSLWWGRLTELGVAQVSNLSANNTPAFGSSIELNNSSLYVELVCRYYLATADGSNNWTISLRRAFESGTTLQNGNVSPTLTTFNTGLAAWREESFSTTLTLATVGRGFLNAMAVTRVGTPANLGATFSLRYRRIR